MDAKNEMGGDLIERMLVAAGEPTAPEVHGAVALDVDASANTDGHAPNAPTREQLRSRRKRDVRARTISVKRMTKHELERGRLLYPDVAGVERPTRREDCAHGEGPCPFVSCKHHLYLDVSPRTGAIKLNFPDLEVWEMAETCALAVADRGGTTLEDVGVIMNLTRERIRQVEVRGLAKLEALREMSELRDFVDEGPVGKRRLPIVTKPVAKVVVGADVDAEMDLDEADEADEADDGEIDFDAEEFASAALDAE